MRKACISLSLDLICSRSMKSIANDIWVSLAGVSSGLPHLILSYIPQGGVGGHPHILPLCLVSSLILSALWDPHPAAGTHQRKIKVYPLVLSGGSQVYQALTTVRWRLRRLGRKHQWLEAISCHQPLKETESLTNDSTRVRKQGFGQAPEHPPQTPISP